MDDNADPEVTVADGADPPVVAVIVVALCLLCLSCVVYLILVAWRKRAAHLDDPDEVEVDLEATLPSYTHVSGLPTYDEALDQLQRRRELRRSSSAQRAIEVALAAARAAGNLITVRKLQTLRQLSVGELVPPPAARTSDGRALEDVCVGVAVAT